MVRRSEFMFNDAVPAKTKDSFYMFYRIYKQTKCKLSTIKKQHYKFPALLVLNFGLKS